MGVAGSLSVFELVYAFKPWESNRKQQEAMGKLLTAISIDQQQVAVNKRDERNRAPGRTEQGIGTNRTGVQT